MTNLDTLAKAWHRVDAVAHNLLKHIENEEQYLEALEAVDGLMLRINNSPIQPHPLDSLLSILIERVALYEEEMLPKRSKRPELVLAYLMEDHGLTQTTLAKETGIDQSTISKLLKAERSPSKAHVQKLAEFFKIDAGVFL